jgi:hypothetical protein
VVTYGEKGKPPVIHTEPRTSARIATVHGVPRTISGRRARVPSALVWSTEHESVDVALFGYLQALGGHDDPKVAGISHLAAAMRSSESTVKRALARLGRDQGPHPAYLTRRRRCHGQTSATAVHCARPWRDAPFDLLNDVTAGHLTPTDFRVWCALQDRARPDGLVTVTTRQLVAELGSETSNPRASYVSRSMRDLEEAGWLVLARSAGLEPTVAVATRRLTALARTQIAFAIRDARRTGRVIHTRNGYDPSTRNGYDPTEVDSLPIQTEDCGPVDNARLLAQVSGITSLTWHRSRYPRALPGTCRCGR